jgi:hypothetical protein
MPQEVHISRYISREHDILIAQGDFTPMFEDYHTHTRRWLTVPDGLEDVLMRQGLAAAGLYLTCRPGDEDTAWTLNLAEPPLNIFITCDAGGGRVVGRSYSEHVATEDHSRIFVQQVRSRGKPHLSAMPVKGFDFLAIFEQYYRQSEQATARFFEPAPNQYLMLMALPDVDEEWLRGVSQAEGVALLSAPDVRQIETRGVVFACSCNRRRVHEVVYKMFRSQEHELFGEDSEVEARCPRCGRGYPITRVDFAALRRKDEGPATEG